MDEVNVERGVIDQKYVCHFYIMVAYLYVVRTRSESADTLVNDVLMDHYPSQTLAFSLASSFVDIGDVRRSVTPDSDNADDKFVLLSRYLLHFLHHLP